jgi:transcription elongation factor Elf1
MTDDKRPLAKRLAGSKACANCQRSTHSRCTGRRHVRAERRYAPCECKECDRRHDAAMAQTAVYVDVVEDSL